jgi:hypothetical protein
VKGSRGPLALKLLILAALCFLAYGPSLKIPLMEDDYPLLWEAQTYGPPSALPVLLHYTPSRLRATSYWTMFALWGLFHTTAWPYHLFSLLLHVVNVWLAWAIASLWPRMRAGAFWAAAFFAVAEGHQEAVVWFASINELYVFLFGGASLVLWLLAGRGERRRLWSAASAGLFALALLSKEPALILLPLFALASEDGFRRSMARLAPQLALTAVAMASIAATRGNSFRFSDGSFSLHAPFWLTWPYGIARVLGIWGWLALAALVWRRPAGVGKQILAALAWIGIALVPYSFLTYSRQIPSRQTYVASFGLALMVGLAMARLRERGLKPMRSGAVRHDQGRPADRGQVFLIGADHAAAGAGKRVRITAAVAAIMLLTNVGYLWTKKRAQFLARAEPTEQLIKLARETDGPIWVRCFPRVDYIAQEAVHMAAGRSPSSLIWSEAEAERRKPAAEFCYQGEK